MRIVSIAIADMPPINRFEVEGLRDLVVLAGPNGVGKTRLMQHVLAFLENPNQDLATRLCLEATCDAERAAWGRDRISTSEPAGLRALKETLKRSRRRREWNSSLLYFDSDRRVGRVMPPKFDWHIPDPYKESIGWNSTFRPVAKRFEETVHSMFKMVEHQKREIAERAMTKQRAGDTSMPLDFGDPMEPFKRVFAQLLAPKTLANLDTSQNQPLQYTVGGRTFTLQALSSGEREVVTVAFDFLLRGPSHCVVLFDEPELHLHPELAYRLIRTLQTIGENNQFILCTHSADIISSALNGSVVFLAPPARHPDSQEPVNQAQLIREEDETNQALRLLGHSIGIISLGKKIVLIEGTEASLDKQVYSWIVKDRHPDLVLVPSEGRELLQSFEVISEKVLSRTLWGVEFFMLCDGDTRPADLTQGQTTQASKLRVLSRYHLENYFLNELVWHRVAQATAASQPWMQSVEAIREKLRFIACEMASYAVALRITSETRRAGGNLSLMPGDCVGKSASELATLIGARAGAESERLARLLDTTRLAQEVRRDYDLVQQSLQDDTDDWKRLLPGRQIVHQFVNHAQLGIEQAKRLYIREAEHVDDSPFQEIEEILQSFASYGA